MSEQIFGGIHLDKQTGQAVPNNPALSARGPSEPAAPLGSLSTGDLLGELTPVIWKGRRYFRIPGPDCDACGGTGWSVVYGAPRRGDGLPHMNGYCFACNRDPQQFLHDRITALVAAKSSPNG